MEQHIQELIGTAVHIVVIQADNPDADSLGSALALEHMLGDMGKRVSLYCGVDMPGYLRYLKGWDRVSSELPGQFDLSIIVDASTLTLLEKLQNSGHIGWVAARPCIVLDHHATVDNQPDFATVLWRDEHVSSTGELVYQLARGFSWPVSAAAGACLMSAILGDTQGLSNDLATPATYRTIAELIELGVDRPKLEEQRRELNRMPVAIFRYKGRLIERAEFALDGRIASVDIPHRELTEYSPLYNPVPLIQNDLLGTEQVAVGIVFKHYADGKVTGAIRCNAGYPVADKLALHLGGGGHPYASGFKVTSGRPFNEIKSECLAYAAELLDNLDKDSPHETLQHPNPQN